MKTFNPEITIETARKLVRSESMMYKDTEHNKVMIAKAIDEIVTKLHNK